MQPDGSLVVSGLNTGWETTEMRDVIAKWKLASFLICDVPPCWRAEAAAAAAVAAASSNASGMASQLLRV